MPRKKIPLAEIEAAYAFNAFRPNSPKESECLLGNKGTSRIMYIENKSDGLSGGEARIGRVTFSKIGRTIYYQSRAFKSLKGGYKANYFETETGGKNTGFRVLNRAVMTGCTVNEYPSKSMRIFDDYQKPS